MNELIAYLQGRYCFGGVDTHGLSERDYIVKKIESKASEYGYTLDFIKETWEKYQSQLNTEKDQKDYITFFSFFESVNENWKQKIDNLHSI